MPYLLLLILLFHFPALVSANNSQQERLGDVKSEIKTLTSDISKKKVSRSEIFQQIKQQEKAISTIHRQLIELNEQLKQQSTHLKTLEQTQQTQRKAHDKQLKALEAQLRAAYINSQPNYLRILLSQQNPADITRSLVYYRYFYQARQQQLTQITTLLESLASDQQILQLERENHQKTYDSQQQQQADLEQHSADRRILIKQLDQQISTQDTKLAALHEEEQALQKLLESLARKKTTRLKNKTTSQALKHSSFGKLNGRLNWPVKGKVVARYGSSRKIGKLKWQGIMISAPPGKSILSVAPGKIVFADWMRGFGLLIIIDHGDQYMTLYGNNRTLFKRVGDNVSAGDMIAHSGERGSQQYAGLYFEVRHKGDPKNPQKWLKK